MDGQLRKVGERQPTVTVGWLESNAPKMRSLLLVVTHLSA